MKHGITKRTELDTIARLLGAIEQEGTTSKSNIVRAQGGTYAGVSRQLKSLKEQQLITEERERNKVLIKLTPKGEQAKEAALLMMELLLGVQQERRVKLWQQLSNQQKNNGTKTRASTRSSK